MAKKNVREMKVCTQSGYNYKNVPQIQLKGVWLREWGFSEDTPITVQCEDGKLIITPRQLTEKEKLVMMVAEKNAKYVNGRKKYV